MIILVARFRTTIFFLESSEMVKAYTNEFDRPVLNDDISKNISPILYLTTLKITIKL